MSTQPSDTSDFFENPRDVLRRHGLQPSRKHSQNFLTARWAVCAIADATLHAAQQTEPVASSTPSVVELGPGAGTLTAALLFRGAHVHAIEKDENMVRLLQAEFASALEDHRLIVETADAANVQFRHANVVGNLPYAITGKILRNLIDQRERIHAATIMIQKEVAERLNADPSTKAYGILSVLVQNTFHATKVCDVAAGNFYPPPKVDSTVIQLKRRHEPQVRHTEHFEQVVRVAFGQRRKTLKKALSAAFTVSDVLVQQCERDGLSLKRRAETLSVVEFGELAERLEATQESPA